MADENTTGTANSEQTTAQTAVVAQATDSSTSTTKSDDVKTDGDTLLGTKAAEDTGTTDATKSADAETKAADETPNALLGAPEGDYTIDAAALPEGMTIDKDALAVITPIAKEIGLSDAGMSKLAGAYAQILPTVTKQITDSIETDAAAQRNAWDAEARKAFTEAKDDAGAPIYAGKSVDDIRKTAARALDRLGGPGLREFLETSGLGNYEPLVRFAFKAGQAIKEDDFSGGTAPAAKAKTDAELFYGKK